MTKKVFHVIERQLLLKILIDYYSYHLDGFRRPKSLDVLKSFFLIVRRDPVNLQVFDPSFVPLSLQKDVTAILTQQTRDSLLIIDNYLLLSHLD
jgi:hypothetical protein